MSHNYPNLNVYNARPWTTSTFAGLINTQNVAVYTTITLKKVPLELKIKNKKNPKGKLSLRSNLNHGFKQPLGSKDSLKQG